MSKAAERIETARRAFLAARGTPNESKAKAALKSAIVAEMPDVKCTCDERPHSRTCALTSRTVALTALEPKAAHVAAVSTDATEPEIRTLGEVIPARDVLAILRSSVQTTLTTALGFRGLALDPQILAELCDELARNAANVLCITEIK